MKKYILLCLMILLPNETIAGNVYEVGTGYGSRTIFEAMQECEADNEDTVRVMNGDTLVVTEMNFLSKVVLQNSSGHIIYLKTEESGTRHFTVYNTAKGTKIIGPDFYFINSAPREYAPGGSIYIEGNDNNNVYFEVSNCTFSNNLSVCGISGGGAIGMLIAENKQGHLKLSNCNFINNTALYSSGGAIDVTAGSGGKCYFSADSCLFSGNEVFDSTNKGGAISLRASENRFYLSRNTFRKNVTHGIGGHGGAIYAYGDNKINIQYCIFDSDSALGTNAKGGALCLAGTGSSLARWVRSSSFGFCYSAYGGAIYFGNNPPTEISTCTFTNNKATVNGAGVYLQNALSSASADSSYFSIASFYDNDADGDGGAVYIAKGNVDFFESIFLRNSCDGDGGCIRQEVSSTDSLGLNHNRVTTFDHCTIGETTNAISLPDPDAYYNDINIIDSILYSNSGLYFFLEEGASKLNISYTSIYGNVNNDAEPDSGGVTNSSKGSDLIVCGSDGEPCYESNPVTRDHNGGIAGSRQPFNTNRSNRNIGNTNRETKNGIW